MFLFQADSVVIFADSSHNIEAFAAYGLNEIAYSGLVRLRHVSDTRELNVDHEGNVGISGASVI